MTANAMCGMIGALIGGAACFSLGFYCAMRLVMAVLDRKKREEEE